MSRKTQVDPDAAATAEAPSETAEVLSQTEQVAPSTAATASADSSAEPSGDLPSAPMLEVRSPQGPRRRIGRNFGPEATLIPLPDLSGDQYELLLADPLLIVRQVS